MKAFMRWRIPALFFSSLALYAQADMPFGIVRGSLVSVGGSALTVRGPQDALYTCSFDARTYFEREHRMIAASGLLPGDPLEVVADRKTGSSHCYARTVEVIEISPPQRPRRARPVEHPAEDYAPRGDFAFGGLVVRREGARLTVRTRAGEIHLNLRPDTRYVSGGLRVAAAALMVNTHVFVRAGRDVDGFLEAYQVVWGAMILLK